MSPPAERADAPPPSFVRNLARTLPFMLICGIVGPIFLVIYLASGSVPEIGWMLWTGLGVTVLDVVLAVAIAAGRTRAQRRTHRLRRTGRRALAQVLSVEQTGVRINDQPLLELRLRIEGGDVTPFEAESRSVISDVRLPLLYAGPLPVLVDPETLEWEFDWDSARPASFTAVGVPSAVPADQRPIADRLAELDSLFQRDLLSREEYDAARARILGEL
ncbi:SHOCT domain-containing protein [Nocardioides antri]|nr:SHOCT domain-containing protein [Nocardioides antri]